MSATEQRFDRLSMSRPQSQAGFGRGFERVNDLLPDPSMYSSLNTTQNMAENEAQLQKYEADIRQHISIE